MWEDPIVAEVRKQRIKIEADCENDFIKIFLQAMKVQEKLTGRLISKPTLRKKSIKTSSIVIK
jgi:hypothetical protein